jgi:hypothetical protein
MKTADTTRCHGPVLTNAEYVYGDSVASYAALNTNPVTKVETIEAISELGSKYGKTDGLS